MKTKTPNPPAVTSDPERPRTTSAESGSALGAAQSELAKAEARAAELAADIDSDEHDAEGAEVAYRITRLTSRVDAAREAHANALATEAVIELDRSLNPVRPAMEALDRELDNARWAHADTGDALRSAVARRDSAVQMFVSQFTGASSPRVVTDVVGTRVDGYALRLNHGPVAASAAAVAAPLLRLIPDHGRTAELLGQIGRDAPRRPTPTTDKDTP